MNVLSAYCRKMKIPISWLKRSSLILFLCCFFLISARIFPQIEFQTLSDRVISPAGTKGASPDALYFDGKFYVAYLQISPVRTFRLIALDKDLMLTGTTDLYSGEDEPTDIRICTDGIKFLYCAFETTGFKRDVPNHLNIARYEFTRSLPVLVDSKTEVAAAMPVVIPDGLPKPGDNLVDDPAPFAYRGYYYAITRKWESAILEIHRFSSDLQRMKTYNLDVGKSFPGLHLSVNSLVEIDGKPYLVSGVSNGPPIDQRFFSYIEAIGFDESMTRVAGKPVVLSKTGKYEDYVACAKYSGGMLFVGYDKREFHSPEAGLSDHAGMIKVFNPKNGFREIGSIQVNSGRMIDNHFTFEIADGKLCVFYQTPDEEIRGSVIAFKSVNTSDPR